MPKTSCVVVTYFPDRPSIEHLYRLACLVDQLIIVDNTPDSDRLRIPSISNSLLIRNKINIGLAAALNQGIRIAGEKGFENIFLLDQDSRVPETFFSHMLDFKKRIDALTDRCALYVPNIYDRNSGTYCRFPVIKKYYFRHRDDRNTSGILLDQGVIAITSGTLMNYSKYLSIGPMPEEYFIDFIDNEYCLRIAKKKMLVAVAFDIVLDHAIGYRQIKSLFGVPVKPNNHEPIRRYYIARNGIRTALLYFTVFPSFSFLVTIRLLHEILTIICFEKAKYEKISAIISGAFDSFSIIHD